MNHVETNIVNCDQSTKINYFKVERWFDREKQAYHAVSKTTRAPVRRVSSHCSFTLYTYPWETTRLTSSWTSLFLWTGIYIKKLSRFCCLGSHYKDRKKFVAIFTLSFLRIHSFINFISQLFIAMYCKAATFFAFALARSWILPVTAQAGGFGTQILHEGSAGSPS